MTRYLLAQYLVSDFSGDKQPNVTGRFMLLGRELLATN
jgi:hypothetical protein